jgi:molybdenum cofactor cytidylyltransferase
VTAESSIVGILLAAGTSSRFGSDKLLHPLADGVPMALASARNLVAGAGRMLAVVRPDAHELRRRLAEADIEWVICNRAEQGMGASLACGVAVSADAQGWVIALADMPFIRPATIRSVATALAQGAPLVAPFFRGRRGHPVGFSASVGDALLALSGEDGGRGVITANARRVQRIDCDDPGIVADVDLPTDLPR